jgi:hypothetical protein
VPALADQLAGLVSALHDRAPGSPVENKPRLIRGGPGQVNAGPRLTATPESTGRRERSRLGSGYVPVAAVSISA